MRHSMLLVLPFVLGAVGCASTAEPLPALDPPADATVVWGNGGQGGAAGRVLGYVHALSKEPTFRPGSETPAEVLSTARYAPQMPPGAPREPADNTLRDAWDRYCRGGTGMSDEKWRLIREAGAPQNVPADFEEGCVHPK